LIIYCAKNRVNGKRYVGQTIRTLDERVKSHFTAALGGSRYVFHNAIRKYGIRSFEFSVIDQADSRAVLDERECYWIKRLRSLVPRGYNQLEGGTSFTEETSKKMSRSAKRRTVSAATRAKLSRAHKGRKLTAEHCAKISAAKLGKKRPELTGPKHPMWGKSSPMSGKKLTSAQRNKISQAMKNGGAIVASKARWSKPDAREKWARTMSGEKHPMYGKHHTKEAKAKIGKANSEMWLEKVHLNKGSKRTAEQRAKMRAAALRRYQSAPHPRLGMRHTEETKLKIKLALAKNAPWSRAKLLKARTGVVV